MELVSLSNTHVQSSVRLRCLEACALTRHHKFVCVCPKPGSFTGTPYGRFSKNRLASQYHRKESKRSVVLQAHSANNADIALTTSPRKVNGTQKLLIPSLPGELGGDQGAPINSGFWEWKPKFSVHFEKAGMENMDVPTMLFLPGFGVGTFHFEKQLRDLGRDFRVWTVDFLGQGLSLPLENPTLSNVEGDYWGFGDESQPWSKELAYSVDLWKDQVEHFVKEVVREPVYLVGNSLGGFVALYFAACYPHLVKGVTLLNATPFWGFFPNPVISPRLSKMFPAGAFPLPSFVKKLTKLLWHKISDPKSVQRILMQVYADHTTDVNNVFSRIIEITEHPAAAAAFASIMFAPMGQLSFNEALSRCQMHGIPICLMYGKEDPWVRPIWGREIKRRLPDVPYYEISPAGHCPHDEVPEVINFLLRGWIKNLESNGAYALPLVNEPENARSDIRGELEYVRTGSRKRVGVQFRGSEYSYWTEMSSVLKSLVEKLQQDILR